MEILRAKSVKKPTLERMFFGGVLRWVAGWLVLAGAVIGGFPLMKYGRAGSTMTLMHLLAFVAVGGIVFVAGVVLLTKGHKLQGASDQEAAQKAAEEANQAKQGAAMM
jgi:hypothetical protein